MRRRTYENVSKINKGEMILDNSNGGDIFAKLKAIAIKVREIFTTVREWYKSNADNIHKYLLAFADFSVWISAIEKLAEKQIVFTDDLDLDFAKEIYNSVNIDELIKKYYFNNNEQNMTVLVERCGFLSEITNYKELYYQTIEAYNKKHYHLACIGIFSILDGILADVSEITNTNFKLRIEAIENKFKDKVELNEVDRKTLCIYTAIEKIENTLFAFSDFSKDEPNTLNRHWLVHGRTRKEYTNYDFLKILLWVDGISYIHQISSQNQVQLSENEINIPPKASA